MAFLFDNSSGEVQNIGYGCDDLYSELWRACTGPLVDVGERVSYFPQGHMEQIIWYITLKPGETVTVEVLYVLTRSLEPFPEEIRQSEPQFVYFRDSAIILSPYHVKEQTTFVKTPSNKVEYFTRVKPTNRAGAETNPFSVVEELVHEVEISHRGSLQITKHYALAHAGARHKVIFSRVEYQSRPSISGVSSFKQLIARLSPRVQSVYYHITLSELEIEPRYPLFGGWKATSVIGYGLPLEDFLFESDDGKRCLNFSFGCPLVNTVVEKFTMKTSYSYLDVVGRTVVVLEKKNVVPETRYSFPGNYPTYQSNGPRAEQEADEVYARVTLQSEDYARNQSISH
ncbi:hypothetical protein C5167_015615 [Papaver somniferum]|uniref:Dolichyl-diphosphooligosaccharide--protein glycosyltransferase subunit 1 n=1 Tax=Papaver somniferum TaxID=3469 RepID=A0A4Y7J9Z1_PAPSO|nr:hypothetical protein C5167_015615 [Papaver somniferum]